MRISFSKHIERLETRPSDFWPGLNANFRPILNTQAIFDLLRDATASDASSSSRAEVGNKRSRDYSSQLNQSFKRAKTSDIDGTYHKDLVRPSYDYPSFSLSYRHSFPNESELVPVLQHMFDIQYAKVSSASQVDSSWAAEEKNMSEILGELRSGAPDNKALTIDLGDVEIQHFRGRFVLTSAKDHVWLLLLPGIEDDIDLVWHDISSPHVNDVLMTTRILQHAGRASSRTQLNFTISPQDTVPSPESVYPFRIQVVSTTSFTPAIFDPFPRLNTKSNTSELEHAQRRLCEYIWPSNSMTPDSFEGTVNIPYFYSILRPAPPLSSRTHDFLQPSALRPILLPFQRRSVAWMLACEGKTISESGDVVSIPAAARPPPFSFWDRIEEGNHTWYLNRLSGLISPSRPSEPDQEIRPLGGILAEEPGLGKTLETIALILLNPASSERNPSVKRWDSEARLEVSAIKTTLIVTPPTLASQWADELAAHAPHLKVMMYDGWAKVPVPITKAQAIEARKKALQVKEVKPKAKGRSKASGENKMNGTANSSKGLDDLEHGIQDWATYVNAFDVVIVTYAILRSDFNVALAAPVRPRRADVVYTNIQRSRSPLVMCEWYRVVMDEVQMVGGGKTEDMVSLIPRLSSFAVSGTPARAQVGDLSHVLKFLRVYDLLGSAKLWNRMISSGFGAAHFAALFQAFAIRTLKAHVKDELTIPQQTRFLVSITLGPVEKHVYDQSLEEALLDLGLDARGIAASEGWQLDGTLLRSSLRKLRGICTHPQVGQLQRLGGEKGLFKLGVVKTIEDVLQNMRETNWRTTMDDQKLKIQTLIRIAQLQQRDEADAQRFQHALQMLLQAERDSQALIKEVESVLEQDLQKKPSNKLTAHATTSGLSDRAKDKQRAVSTPFSDLDDEDNSDQELDDESSRVESPATEERRKKRGALHNRLRECRLTLHRVKFFQGDVYHCLGDGHGPEEDAAYEAAEKIRRQLLKSSEQDALRAMALLENDATRHGITLEAVLVEVNFVDSTQLEDLIIGYEPTNTEKKMKPPPRKVILFNRARQSRDFVIEVNTIIEDVLNQQSALLWEWRMHIIALLTEKLSQDEDDKVDGEEYQRNLDNQGEVETYIQCYAALLSDRRQAITSERTLLAEHDIKERKKRKTKVARHAELDALDPEDDEEIVDMPDDVEANPEHDVLRSELSIKRKILFEQLAGRAVKSVLIDLSAASASIGGDRDPEKVLLKDIISQLRRFIAEQGSLLEKLEADLTLIRKAFNQRILYFRQLQEISDSVAEVVWDGTIVDALMESTMDKNELEANVNRNRARQRYLENLTTNRDECMQEEDEACILCRCDFIRGFVTPCAHIFCEGCMKAWLLRKEGKTCPVCRVAIDPSTIERFSINEDKAEYAKKILNKEPIQRSSRKISYNMISPTLFHEIQAVESYGDYGSKIQALIRHLLYLKFSDPGSKSIVFSAWADSLHIMQRALKENGIQSLRIDQRSKGQGAAKIFKNDPNILVLLLHGERENAGLNITCASRVFLLESVVHHAFEIQAIARIDRMGQTRPTEVYCYYAEDTVERNILDLAARKGLSLYTTENSAGTLSVSSLRVDTEEKIDDSPKKKAQKKGDFIFKLDDMLAILFPHMYEELKYLVPPDDSILPEPVNAADVPDRMVAGPSRLPLN